MDEKPKKQLLTAVLYIDAVILFIAVGLFFRCIATTCASTMIAPIGTIAMIAVVITAVAAIKR